MGDESVDSLADGTLVELRSISRGTPREYFRRSWAYRGY